MEHLGREVAKFDYSLCTINEWNVKLTGNGYLPYRRLFSPNFYLRPIVRQKMKRRSPQANCETKTYFCMQTSLALMPVGKPVKNKSH